MSSLVVFDDTDTQTISYSTTWVGYQGQAGNIDARDWTGQSFHACRAEPLNGSIPCWANITFIGSSISLYSEHSNLQQRYWCGLIEQGNYKWYNGSTLKGETEETPFTWSLNRTRCAVAGLDGDKEHTLVFGQLAEDTQGIGITLDYYSVDESKGSASGQPTWTSDFVSVDTPPNVSWAGTSNGTASTSSTAATRSATSSTTNSVASNTLSSSSTEPSSTASANNETSSGGDGGGSSTSSIGIGVGVGFGGLALLLVGGLLLWRNKRKNRGRPSSLAPTETTYGGFQSVSGGSPVSRNGRGRFPSTSQSYLPSHSGGGAASEYGTRVPEVQAADDQLSSPATTFGTGTNGDPSSRFLANPATFRER